jgi:Domain of unknown function (DUF4259)
MGAWDVDTFDNDTACDWTYQLEDVDDLSLVREALASVIDIGDDYLDADLACEALAACEVVARLKGNWGKRNSYTETADAWVESHQQSPPTNLISVAVSVIDRILSPPSELLDLWSESDASKWRAAVEDLRSRVRT